MDYSGGELETMHISVTSPAGAYTVGNASFFRYIVKLTGTGLRLHAHEREALTMLTAIPHAFFDEEDEDARSGLGWRVVPSSSIDDWPVLESTPQRFRDAIQTARRILWEHADPIGMSAGDIVAIESELDELLSVLRSAEEAGFPVNLSYVS